MARTRLFASLCGLVFLVNLARIVFAPLLNVFIAEFGIGEATAGLMVTLAWIGSASPRLPTGWILTKVPRHHVVLASGSILAVSVFIDWRLPLWAIAVGAAVITVSIWFASRRTDLPRAAESDRSFLTGALSEWHIIVTALVIVGAFSASVFALTAVDGLVALAVVTAVVGFVIHALFPAVDTYLLDTLPDATRGSAYAVFSSVWMLPKRSAPRLSVYPSNVDTRTTRCSPVPPPFSW